MKNRFKESVNMILPQEPNLYIVTDNMIAEWGSIRYSQLSVMLVYLKFLATVHQTHHWITKGDSFYGDHLLYQHLYLETIENIDMVAEKAVGLGSIDNVNLVLITSQLMKLVQGYGMTSTIPQITELAKRSYLAEINFLKVTAHLAERLKECGLMTRGLDNMIQGLEDKHENTIFLLKQKTNIF